jgi:putative transposase
MNATKPAAAASSPSVRGGPSGGVRSHQPVDERAKAPRGQQRPSQVDAPAGCRQRGRHHPQLRGATATPTGTLIRKIACHPKASVSTPPTRTPTAPPLAATAVQAASALWRVGPSGKAVLIRDSAAGDSSAAALKKENQDRPAAGVRRILRAQLGWAPDERTLCRHFARLGLMGTQPGAGASVFGRFEADRPNELWTGDALHGPVVAGRKTYLFAFETSNPRLGPWEKWTSQAEATRLPVLRSRGS